MEHLYTTSGPLYAAINSNQKKSLEVFSGSHVTSFPFAGQIIL
jgi:hypothetical protein